MTKQTNKKDKGLTIINYEVTAAYDFSSQTNKQKEVKLRLKNLFLRLIWPFFDKGEVRACTWEAFKHKHERHS